ncbi:cadherin repeat domain-containing protein [Hanstruepera marina]|uniref:cadherin repeat domain-containing protein n=1 Tax=Hanstruepera marina TaxID=2873265 RepID=UPI001CA7ADF0|nr:cadherin repeat domain-containing protein [Hanstruepera marina]
MKNQVKLVILFVLITVMSCSNSDDSQNPPNNSDGSTVEIAFNENPRSGDLITIISTNLSGDVTFSLSSESVSNAFTLDSNSGELRVAAWQVFDFETNEVITATVAISNGTESSSKVVIVNLNNMDDIWSFLNDSRSAYESASNGQWVMITENEYNDLANYLYDVNKCGASNSQYYRSNSISYDSALYTYANDNNATVEPENYVFAFKYVTNANNQTNAKIKTSTSLQEGYQNVGSSLPQHSSGENYFVLKGANGKHPETTYMALAAEGIGYYNGISNHSFKYGNFDTNSLPYNWTGIAIYQGLSSSLKQWN